MAPGDKVHVSIEGFGNLVNFIEKETIFSFHDRN